MNDFRDMVDDVADMEIRSLLIDTCFDVSTNSTLNGSWIALVTHCCNHQHMLQTVTTDRSYLLLSYIQTTTASVDCCDLHKRINYISN